MAGREWTKAYEPEEDEKTKNKTETVQIEVFRSNRSNFYSDVM